MDGVVRQLRRDLIEIQSKLGKEEERLRRVEEQLSQAIVRAENMSHDQSQMAVKVADHEAQLGAHRSTLKRLDSKKDPKP